MFGGNLEMIKKLFKNVDFGILIIVLLIFCIGIISLKSASNGAGGDPNEYTKQISWFIVGLISSILIVFFDYKLLKKISIFFYIITILLLLIVLRMGAINGASSWIRFGPLSIQPSEFAKIAIIIIFAQFIEFLNEKKALNKIYNILICLLIVGVPIALIIKQPDYGTAIVIVTIFAAMLYAGGINWKYIMLALLAAAICFPLLYSFVLPAHAKQRIDVFLNPDLDPRGAGYNIIQSKLAIGSGMLVGMGLFNGNQTQMGLLPMKTTDFIFPVLSEELGFIVSSSIIILYAVLSIRIINVGRNTKDDFGKLICIGVFAMLFAHVVENIGMCMGLLPITGIPLPFMSYGGSSMLTNMIAIGIVLSISARRRKHLF